MMWTGRKRHLALLTAALAVLAGAVALSAQGVARTASTDDLSKPDPAGDVEAKGLTPRERGAIDIVRVEATGDTFGAIVTVTFAASFEAVVGRGKLSDAIAGIVLRPKSGRPTVVATRGPGVRGDDGGGMGGRGPFVVVRQSRTLTFIARNVDFTKVRRLEAKSFSALTRARRTTQGALFDPEFYTLIASRPGEDFWAAETVDDLDPEVHCQNLREQIDRVEMSTWAPFQRVDHQPVVVNTSSRTFRVVSVTASSDRTLSVAIQPPMQPAEGLSVVVKGLPSGTRIEITPYGEGTRGQPSVVTTA
jgi:hypothetical protein